MNSKRQKLESINQEITKKDQVKKQLESLLKKQPQLLQQAQTLLKQYELRLKEKQETLAQLTVLPNEIMQIMDICNPKEEQLTTANSKEQYFMLASHILQVNRYSGEVQKGFVAFMLQQQMLYMNM